MGVGYRWLERIGWDRWSMAQKILSTVDWISLIFDVLTCSEDTLLAQLPWVQWRPYIIHHLVYVHRDRRTKYSSPKNMVGKKHLQYLPILYASCFVIYSSTHWLGSLCYMFHTPMCLYSVWWMIGKIQGNSI